MSWKGDSANTVWKHLALLGGPQQWPMTKMVVVVGPNYDQPGTLSLREIQSQLVWRLLAEQLCRWKLDLCWIHIILPFRHRYSKRY